jgi:chromosomal replication initiation ATPase DnaA
MAGGAEAIRTWELLAEVRALVAQAKRLELAVARLTQGPPEGCAGTEPAMLLAAVAAHYNLGEGAILARTRTKRVAWARQVLCYLLHERGLSYSEIGRWIHRDHSAIWWGTERVKTASLTEAAVQRDLAAIKARVP